MSSRYRVPVIRVGKRSGCVDFRVRGRVSLQRHASGGRTTAVASAVAGSTGGSLVQAGQLTSSSPAAHLTTLAASGQTAVAVDQTSGLVTVFSEPGSGWSSGMQVAQLDVPGITAVTPSGAADLAVAVSGSTIVVGNSGAIVGANSGEGAAYVYAEPAGGWSGTIEPSAGCCPQTASRPGPSDFRSRCPARPWLSVVGILRASPIMSSRPGRCMS